MYLYNSTENTKEICYFIVSRQIPLHSFLSFSQHKTRQSPNLWIMEITMYNVSKKEKVLKKNEGKKICFQCF